jgi:hypothetical protein
MSASLNPQQQDAAMAFAMVLKITVVVLQTAIVATIYANQENRHPIAWLIVTVEIAFVNQLLENRHPIA